MGASAMALSPQIKRINIQIRNALARAGAVANSFQLKTPQAAEIIVAPWPIEYETAGPTMCAREATKLKIAPVHQIAPPSVPQRCHDQRADAYPPNETGSFASSGFLIKR